jgi:RNA polymerase sigma-70 factor (ECF subfamily)
MAHPASRRATKTAMVRARPTAKPLSWKAILGAGDPRAVDPRIAWRMASVNHQAETDAAGGQRRPAMRRSTLESDARRRYQGDMQGDRRIEAAAGAAAVAHGALLRRVAQHQDRMAFAALFEHFGPRIKSYLLKLGAERGLAEDLVQDVMLAVWRRAATYDPSQAGVATWIFTIARNKRIDALRRGPRADFDPTDPALAPEPPRSPDDEADAVHWEGAIADAVATMPREQAEIIRLAYYEDISHSDIAARIGVPLGTVKSRLRLAMARLRTRFGSQD